MSGISFLFTAKRSTFAAEVKKYTGTMKKYHLTILAAILLLTACKNEPNDWASLKGFVQGLGNDTIYLYGTDRLFNHVDTIPVEGDKFAIEVKVDTLVSAWLRFGDGTEFPIFLDKMDRIEINGSAGKLGELNVKGNPANDELALFFQELAGKEQLSEQEAESMAEDFIEKHPSSLASIYVLDRFFVQQSEPDFQKIAELVGRMAGNLKDRLYMEQLQEYLDAYEKAAVGKIVSFFQIPGVDGKNIRRADFKDKYLLVYFWASWNARCKEMNRTIRELYRDKKYRKKFDVLGISLDIDKRCWLNVIEADTLDWTQACDFKGWNGSVVSQFAVRQLPANVLLAPNGRVEGRNLTREQIEQKLIEIASKK